MMIAVHVLQYLIIPQYKSLPSNVSSTEMLTTLLQVSWCHVMAVSRKQCSNFTVIPTQDTAVLNIHYRDTSLLKRTFCYIVAQTTLASLLKLGLVE